MNEKMILPLADLAVERWDDPARGSVTWKTLFSADRTPTSAMTVGIAEFPPGETKIDPPHRHAPPEVYFILGGVGYVEIDGEQTEVAADTAVFIPGNAPHRVVNTGNETLRLLYAFAVDSFSDVTYVFPES